MPPTDKATPPDAEERLRAAARPGRPRHRAPGRAGAHPARSYRRARRPRAGQDRREHVPAAGSRSTWSSPPTGCASWPRWTARSSCDRDASRHPARRRAAAADPDIPTDEQGTRHRTADRVAKQTGFPVDLASASRCTSSRSTSSGRRYVLEDSAAILSRANQALATLERYKLRLDEVGGTLSALEIEDLVTVRDVAGVAQRLEMVRRIAARDRRLRRRARHRRAAAVAAARRARRRRRGGPPAGRPRLPAGASGAGRAPSTWSSPSSTRCQPPTCSTSCRRRARLGLGGARRPRRRPSARAATGCWPRCRGCPGRRRPPGRALRQPAEAARRQHRRPAGRRGRRRGPRPHASARACPGWPSPASSSATSEVAAYLLETSSNRPRSNVSSRYAGTQGAGQPGDDGALRLLRGPAYEPPARRLDRVLPVLLGPERGDRVLADPVLAPAVGLTHDPQLVPEEVHPVPPAVGTEHPYADLRRRQATRG